jgi:large subunit ribosomal protein L39e
MMLKKKLGKEIKKNRPLPNWYRFKKNNKIKFNMKRRNWRKTKLKL